MNEGVTVFNKQKENKYFIIICVLLLFFLFFIANKNLNCFSINAYANTGQPFNCRIKSPKGDYFTVKDGVEYIFEIENISSVPLIEIYFIPEDVVKFKNYAIASQESPMELNSYIEEDINRGSKLKYENEKWIFSLVFKSNGTFYANVLYDDKQEEIIAYIGKIDIDAPTITSINEIDFDITPYGRIYKVPFSDESKSISGSKSGIKTVDIIKDKESTYSMFDNELYVLLTDIKPLDSFDSYLNLIEMYDNKFNCIDLLSATLEDGYYKFNIAEPARYYLRVEDNAGNVNYYFFLNHSEKTKDFRYYVDMYIGTIPTAQPVYAKLLFDNYIQLLESKRDLTKLETYNSFLAEYHKEVKIFELGNYGNETKLASYQQMRIKKQELDSLYETPKVNCYVNGNMQTDNENDYNINLRFESQNLFENIEGFKYGEKIDLFFILESKPIRTMPSRNPNRSYRFLVNVKKDDLDCELKEDKMFIEFRFSSHVKCVKINNQLLKNGSEIMVDLQENLEIEMFDVQYAKKFNVIFYSVSAIVFVILFVFYVLIIVKKLKGFCCNFNNYLN